MSNRAQEFKPGIREPVSVCIHRYIKTHVSGLQMMHMKNREGGARKALMQGKKKRNLETGVVVSIQGARSTL